MDNLYGINYNDFQGVQSTSITDIEDNVSNYYNINNYRAKMDQLYSSLNGAIPTDNVSDVIYQDSNIDDEILIDIDKNKFKQIWTDYRLIYNDKNNSSIPVEKEEFNEQENIIYDNKFLGNNSYVLDNFDSLFDELLSKKESVISYLDNLKQERQDIKDKNELIELSKKELEQEKEMLAIEKKDFEEYKLKEQEKINNNLLRFQNIVEEINNKIDEIMQ